MSAPRAACAGLVLALVAALGACPASRGARGRFGRLGPAPGDVDEHGQPLPPPALAIARAARTIDVTLEEGQAHLGALWLTPTSGSGPTIVIVPGGGDISRNGTRTSDGVSTYAKPVDVNLAWAEAFARRGARVLTFDKRTCGPNDDPLCAKNPQSDVDAEGPAALTKDVDAACALARAEPGFDGTLVLFAHGQAAQVALASHCAPQASALVLLAPIPRAIDQVIVAGLKERTASAEQLARGEKEPAAKQALLEQANQLKNQAGTREAEFASIQKDRFAPTARVGGATLAFWKGWMDLTARTADLVAAVPAPKVVVLGERDVQYGAADRERIRALSPDATFEVAGADHHLLTDGALAESTVDVVGTALDKVLSHPSS